MKIFTCLFCFWLVQISLARVLSERQINSESLLGYRDRLVDRGVTYIKPPSNVSGKKQDESEIKNQNRNNGQNLNYSIFEDADERGSANAPIRVTPTPSPSSGTQVAPQKVGPVLFPDEEAAAENNGNNQNSGQANQDKGLPASTTKSPPNQENNPNNANQNKGKSQQSGNSNGNSSRDGNNSGQSPSNNNRNGNNSGGRDRNNNNNGRGNVPTTEEFSMIGASGLYDHGYSMGPFTKR